MTLLSFVKTWVHDKRQEGVSVQIWVPALRRSCTKTPMTYGSMKERTEHQNGRASLIRVHKTIQEGLATCLNCGALLSISSQGVVSVHVDSRTKLIEPLLRGCRRARPRMGAGRRCRCSGGSPASGRLPPHRRRTPAMHRSSAPNLRRRCVHADLQHSAATRCISVEYL